MASRQPRYNFQVLRGALRLLTACLCAVMLVALRAQHETLPAARLLSAPRLVMPGAVDSNVPMTWELVDGAWRLFAFTSWGGIPALLTGSALDHMQRIGVVAVVPHPGYGVWIDSVIADDSGTWYGYYHHEVPAEACGTPERSIPRIASARSTDRGLTWEDLGIVLEAPPDSSTCLSPSTTSNFSAERQRLTTCHARRPCGPGVVPSSEELHVAAPSASTGEPDGATAIAVD